MMSFSECHPSRKAVMDDDCVDSPDTLWQLCLDYCTLNRETFCDYNNYSGFYTLKKGVTLPQEVCEKLLANCAELGLQITGSFLNIFRNLECTRLRDVSLRGLNKLVDRDLTWVLSHRLHRLDLSGCDKLSPSLLFQLNCNGSQLRHLFLGSSSHILDVCEMDIDLDIMEEAGLLNVLHRDGEKLRFGEDYILYCPVLRSLSLHNLKAEGVHDMVTHDVVAMLLRPLDSLVYLDLSGCEIAIHYMDCLENLVALRTLILHAVPIQSLQGSFENIVKLKQLR